MSQSIECLDGRGPTDPTPPQKNNKCFNKYIAKKSSRLSLSLEMYLLIISHFPFHTQHTLLVFLRASREGEALLLGTEIGHSKNGGALLRKTVVERLKAASTEEERLKRACTVCAHHLLTQRLTVLQRSRKGKHIGTQRQDEPSNQDGPP